MIIRTDAVVLRTLKYGETSVIATLFTRDRGKLAVLAKGARLTKSRFGSTLQPMSYTQVVLYYKTTRGLQTLTESAHVQPFPRIGRDLEKMSIGLRAMELIYALMPDEEQNPQVFNLVLQVLTHLDTVETNAANLLPYFQLRLAMILGFAPDVERDAVEALSDEGGVLALDAGSVHPLHAAPGTGRRASRTALRAYAVFARADLETIMRMQLTDETRREVNALVEDFLHYHVEDAYPTRSDKVFGQLMHPGPPPGARGRRNA